MIDRRNFLATVGCAAASLPLSQSARASALSAGAEIETLHILSGVHPGFAYFAGLPGRVGMPFTHLMQWLSTADARNAFADLQNVCGVACVIVGTRSSCTLNRMPKVGPYAAILQALGRTSADANIAGDQYAIALHDVTLALTMPREQWLQLSDGDRAVLISAAARVTAADAGKAKPDTQIASLASTVVDRIAEAVVAGIANHDALTRRINASYFAFKAVNDELRSKNAV